ncbi:MAG: T9SS type A sorting domain-containing protein [Crocinitomicaceae bacterium]
MKILYYFIALVTLFPIGIHAQNIVNPNFEDWTPSGSQPPFNWEEPTDWKSTNAQTEFTLAGAGKTTDSYNGPFACQLQSVPISGGWPTTLCNGNPNPMGSPFSDPGLDIITGGTPINSKPDKLVGYYKFGNNNVLDSGYAKVILKKYNPTLNMADTIGMGHIRFGETANYTQFEIIINDLAPSILPDSIVIAFYSTDPSNPLPRNPPSIGLIIDSLVLVHNTVTVENYSMTNFNPIIYPNPAKNWVTIYEESLRNYSVELFNMNGQKLMSVYGKETLKLNVSSIAPGIYYLKIKEQDKDYSIVKSIIIE